MKNCNVSHIQATLYGDNDDQNEADLVIFPPDKVDALPDDEEVNEDVDKLGNILPNDVAGSIEININCDFERTSKLLQFSV